MSEWAVPREGGEGGDQECIKAYEICFAKNALDLNVKGPSTK